MTSTQEDDASGDEDVLALSGIRVIEFCHMVMGPTAGMILADLGADVIKIEPINGDTTRRLVHQGAGFFATYNRNKRSLALDLKTPGGLAAAKRLAEGADVIVENLRPGALDDLGLGYTDMSADNPGLIYCALKGFLDGPYAHRKALDEVVQMMGGLAYMTGPTGRPLRAGASVTDIMGGMFGVIGIMAALRDRERTGRGQPVSAALYETTVHMVAQHMMQYAVTGEPSGPMPDRPRAWAVYDTFQTSDGKSVFIGIVSDTQWRIFCEAFARQDLMDDPDLASNAQRFTARDRIMPLLRELFGALPKAELMEICDRIGLPFAPIARPHDLFEDPHLQESRGLLDVTLPDGRPTKVPALPLMMDGNRTKIRRDLPRIGEHSNEILIEAGYSPEEIQALLSDGAVVIEEQD
ncbi:MAG: CoA transferase [Rhodospirillaceae bacterium]|nr:CoA transferase [Rhodospirillaceae bacterium]MBT5296901.1 CoA transferase [Rhodospirillaceae bacterium]MBT5513804.1 CoA transferase [Rhodospirillaceae bacterium]MBT6607976.1 CoA transferase [Rhodospirillaceae bacterium]MBT7249679.1 CoA transferase [Rhodospirillaceae bacterium]